MTRDHTTLFQPYNNEDIGEINNSLMIEWEVTKTNEIMDNWKMIKCIYWIQQNIYFPDKPLENFMGDDKNMDENIE